MLYATMILQDLTEPCLIKLLEVVSGEDGEVRRVVLIILGLVTGCRVLQRKRHGHVGLGKI